MFVTVAVPGRIEFLGNHTDYNGGRVLVVPTRRKVRVTITTVSRPGATLRSAGFAGEIRRSGFSLHRRAGRFAWANHALGAMRLGLEHWPRRGGLRVEIEGDLPAGAGLSSSAALNVAVLRALARLAGRRPANGLISALAQQVENDFVGVPVGPLDPLSCAVARPGSITRLDFGANPPRWQYLARPRDWKVLLFATTAPRTLQSSAYASRRAECTAAANALGLEALGSLSSAEFCRRARHLPELLRRRARHVVEELERVDGATRILQSGRDLAKIGALLNDSHASSQRNFENSHPVVDAVVARLRWMRGVAGARLTGGGFGGAVIAWARAEEVAGIARRMSACAGDVVRLLEVV